MIVLGRGGGVRGGRGGRGGGRGGGGGFGRRHRRGGGFIDTGWGPGWIMPEIVTLPVPVCPDGYPPIAMPDGQTYCPTKPRGTLLLGSLVQCPGKPCPWELPMTLSAADAAAFVDMQAIIRQLKAVKPFTYANAKMFAALAQNVVDRTIELGGVTVSSFGIRKILGVTSAAILVRRLKDIRAHLDSHEDQIKKGIDPTAPYSGADDLKKWIVEAFIEYNSAADIDVHEGAARDQFFSDVMANLRGLPKKILEGAFGLPLWAIVLIAAGAAALVLGGASFLGRRSATSAAVEGYRRRRRLAA